MAVAIAAVAAASSPVAMTITAAAAGSSVAVAIAVVAAAISPMAVAITAAADWSVVGGGSGVVVGGEGGVGREGEKRAENPRYLLQVSERLKIFVLTHYLRPNPSMAAGEPNFFALTHIWPHALARP